MPTSPIPLPPPDGVNRRRAWSVGAKLAGATTALIALVTLGIYIKLSRYQRENLLQAKEAGAAALTRLFADSCAAAVVFDDAAALQESLATLGRNPEVEYGSVWAVDRKGAIAGRLAELQRGLAEPLTDVPGAVRLRREADRVVLVAPVHDIKGRTIAVVVATFSLARENRVMKDVERTTLLVSSAVAIVLIVLLMAMARLAIVGPLSKLVSAAKRLEEGRAGDVDVHTNDEVGQLARAFRTMASAIEVREQRIGARNRDMRLVLDNVGQGFITLDATGAMSAERSRVVDEWFGAASDAPKFWDYLARTDADVASWFEVGWAAVRENFLPIDLCLDQLPKLVRKDGRTFELAYRPILKGTEIDRAIIVITDITGRIERERAEQQQREMMSLFRRLLADRAAFEEFFTEAGGLVDAATSSNATDLSLLERQIHTLKGNCALFGLESIAEFCHELESRLGESAEALTAADKSRLRLLWTHVSQMRDELTDDEASRIDLGRDDYQALLADLRRGASHDLLISTVASWEYEPAAKRLAWLAEHIERLAARLDKAPVDVTCLPTDLRLPQQRWASFWAVFAHVIRNTVDHGVETTEARASAGLPGRAAVTLGIAREGDRVVVTVSDDGRGVDWAKIAEKARARRLPADSRPDLEEALFTQGISSRSEATSTSGRGIGLGAVRQVVRELGGSVELRSETGRGATLRCVLPQSMLLEAPGVREPRHASPVTVLGRPAMLP